HRRRTVSLSYYSLFSSSSYCDHRDLHSFLHDALPICLPGIPGRRPSHAAFDGSCAMKKISHFTSADWRRTTRALLTVLAVGILLVWLFTRADSMSTEQHQDYSRRLLGLQQLDAELNASVLANRYDLYRNYDRSSQAVSELQAMGRALGTLPDYLSSAVREELNEVLEQLQAAIRDKADAVDRYKRESAVLRNSQSYFPVITDGLIREGVLERALSREVGIFGRSVMTFLLDNDAERGQRLWEERARLLQVADTLPPAAA